MKKECRNLRRLVCLLGAFCLLCAAASAEQTAPELLEPAGVQLNAAVAYIGEISKITAYEASVVPYMQEFYFEQEGVVDTMHVVAGQLVKAGEPLITLDTEAEEERIETLRKEIEQLETNGSFDDELASIDLKILDVELRALLAQTPRDENAVALKQLEVEEKQLAIELDRSLRALSLEQLQSELALLEAEIEKNVLYAPFDGRVMYMTSQLQRGSYVSAYSPLIYLADDTQLFVESPYISSITLNSAHAVYALIGSSRYELTPVPLDGREYLSQVLSGEKPMLQFTINQPDDQLSAGQYAAVCVETDYVADALLVPTNCLYSDTTRYLYVMENGVRVRRDVKTGINTDWYTQITEGLEEGELVYVKE